MTSFNNVVYAIVIILLCYIIYLQSCGKNTNTVSTNTIKKEYIYDTIVRSYPVLYPKVQYITYKDTIKINYTDSNFCKQLAREYYANKIYTDTLKDDSVDTYIVTEVEKNEIVKQKVSYKLNFPVSVNKIEDKRIKFYLSPEVYFNAQNIYIGGEVMLTDKKDFGYSISGLYSPVFNDYLIGVSFKYKLKFK